MTGLGPTKTCNCSILGGTTDSRPCPIHDVPVASSPIPHHGDASGDRIVACPRCGRQTIDVRRYIGKATGDVNYIHAQHVAPPFGFIMVDDSCYVCPRDGKAARS